MALLAIGCGDEDPLTTSCGGDVIPNCRMFEYSQVQSASLTPDGIEPGDPNAEAVIEVSFESCGADAPRDHEVLIQGLAASGGGGDAGSARLFNIITLRDDGSTFGDATARDGQISVTVANPFASELPANAELTLRFESRIDVCAGANFEIPYRTGNRWQP